MTVNAPIQVVDRADRESSPATSPGIALGEIAQAKIRCWMNLVLIVLALLAYGHQPSISLRAIWYTFVFTALSAGLLLWWARAVSGLPQDAPRRVAQRVASLVLDNASISWILYFGEESLAGIVAVYLWLTIGYGTRFGLRYLFANLGLSLLCFACVAYLSPFWRQYTALAFGLGMGLVVIPLYAAYLISRLHSAVRRAEAASSAKSDFLAKMSHELRTPLHGIIALADLLGGTQSAHQKQEMIRQISVASNTLLDLINRILDISKYQSGTFALQTQEMNLHAVVDDTISILAPQAHAKGISISAFVDSELQPLLIGSPLQLQEVLINLAGNALKFTERGGVRVLATKDGQAEGLERIRISIVDTGPGMPKEFLQRIFDPFSQQDDSMTRLHGGTGLGTTIARDLVRLMNGELSIESEVGVGTTVIVTLALPHAPARSEPLSPQVAAAVLAAAGQGARFAERLRERGLRHVSEVVVADLPLLADCCVFVDLDIAPETLQRLRAQFDAGAYRMLPMIGFARTDASVVAAGLPLLSFVTVDGSDAALERAVALATRVLQRVEEAAEPAVAGNGYSVLIAEDNMTNQMIARIALERAGYACTIVDDGEKALAELSSGRFDAALIDMHMPRMDGLEVARHYNFATFDDDARTPIIMVTADNRPDVVADADLAGISRFVVKPIKPSILLRTLQDLLEQRGESEHTAATGEPLAGLASGAVEAGLDPVILDELLSYMEGDEARQFFAEFGEDAHGYIDCLRSFATGQIDFEKVRERMHALSGAGRTVGAPVLADRARQIEYGSEAEFAPLAAQLADELDVALTQALAGITRRLDARA
jgi:two-component system sensor histidine kinase RpfC